MCISSSSTFCQWPCFCFCFPEHHYVTNSNRAFAVSSDNPVGIPAFKYFYPDLDCFPSHSCLAYDFLNSCRSCSAESDRSFNFFRLSHIRFSGFWFHCLWFCHFLSLL